MATGLDEWDIIGRVVGAAFFGGLVGVDRESRSISAGMRTHAMIAAGAALFVGTANLAFSNTTESAGDDFVPTSPDRILAGVASGVGFLGAGSIIKDGHFVKGLTTAAGIWTVAGIGATVAYGNWYIGLLAAAMAIFIQISDYFFDHYCVACLKKTTEEQEENKEKTAGETGSQDEHDT